MKLFIGNLSSDATEDEIMTLFSDFGPVVEFHRPLDRETGLPRRFAFVTLENREKGEAAHAKLDGLEFFGRKLGANEAEDRTGDRRPQRERSSQRNDVESSRGDTQPKRRGDDRPVGADGNRMRYKGI